MRMPPRLQQRFVLFEDHLLELPHPWGGFDPELLGQNRAQPLVGGEGISLAAGSVERSHEDHPHAFPVGVLGDEALRRVATSEARSRARSATSRCSVATRQTSRMRDRSAIA